MTRFPGVYGTFVFSVLISSSLLMGATAPKAAAAPAAPSTILDLSKVDSEITFLAVGNPGVLRIRGEVDKAAKDTLKGDLTLKGNTLSGTAKFALSSLKTGIAMRDRHMKENYLKVAEHPEALLTLNPTTLPEDVVATKDVAEKSVPFTGTLTVKGIQNPVTGTVLISRKESALKFAFDFNTKISKHGMELPSFMGVTVAEDVKISVAINAKL